MSRCTQCGAPVVLMEHHFLEGVAERPVRRWSIAAALYFFSRACGVKNFCGATCASAWHRANVEPSEGGVPRRRVAR